jgi:hypothetical protein
MCRSDLRTDYYYSTYVQSTSLTTKSSNRKKTEKNKKALSDFSDEKRMREGIECATGLIDQKIKIIKVLTMLSFRKTRCDA